MPTFSPSSSIHISTQFSRKPKSPFGASVEEQQGIPIENRSSTLNNMRPHQEPKKVSNGSMVKKEKVVKYRECRKNHAANIGGYAVDGCREFMASGEEGTSAALKCAACNCHRSFHKREVESEALCDCSSNSTSRR